MNPAEVVAQVARWRGDSGQRVPGVVLEVSGRSAVVLAEGHFLRIPAIPGWEPGEEVWVGRPEGRSTSGRWGRVAAVVVAFITVTAGSAVWAGLAFAQGVAVVSVDINPSLQMTVNGQGRVIRVVALDTDGQTLLRQAVLRNLPLPQAVATVVGDAVKDGYLAAAGSTASTDVVLVAAAPSHASAAALPTPVVNGLQQAQTQAETVLQQHHVTATVAVSQAPWSATKTAQSMGISVGQYEMYQHVAAAGVKEDARSWRDQPVGQNLTKAGVPSKDVAAVVAAVAKNDQVDKVIEAARHGASPAVLDRMLNPGPSEAGPSPDGHGSDARGGATKSSTATTSDGSKGGDSKGGDAGHGGSGGQGQGNDGKGNQPPGPLSPSGVPSSNSPGLVRQWEDRILGSHARRGDATRSTGGTGSSGNQGGPQQVPTGVGASPASAAPSTGDSAAALVRRWEQALLHGRAADSAGVSSQGGSQRPSDSAHKDHGHAGNGDHPATDGSTTRSNGN